MTQIFEKQEREVYDYYVDMRKFFADLTGDRVDTPASVITEIEPSGELVAQGIVLDPAPALGFSQWFAAGKHMVKYKVTFLVTTHNGRKVEVDMYLKVKNK